MNSIQGTLQMMEVGKGSFIVRVVPFLTVLAIIGFCFNVWVYKGLNDPQSMDNAQLARQIARGNGFTTEFLRPHAVSQLHDYAISVGLKTGKAGDLFPPEQFPPGVPRILPDTYNAPGYPYLLAVWFRLVHPDFDQPAAALAGGGMYSPDRWIPILNEVFFFLTGVVVFILGLRLFDHRVAWMAVVAYVLCGLIWKYALSGMSTTLLMFLTTAAFWCIMEIVAIGERCFDSEEGSFGPAWIWGLILTAFLAGIFLTRLHFLVLIVPVAVVLFVMPSGRLWLTMAVVLFSTAAVAPWYFHLYKVSGSMMGSNAPLLLHGTSGYEGNQVYCTSVIPPYEQLFRDASKKEYSGFRWNFEHAWSLLGASPMVLLFGASILHNFKRRRSRIFHWLIYGSIIALLLANNLGEDKPDDFGPWNALVILLPCMIVVGSAFFFVLLGRLALQLRLLNKLIVIFVIVFSAMPVILTLLQSGGLPFNWPPYMPFYLKQVSRLAQRDEWVTSDMPWATAWYGDRASLWLPDALADFENFHDNVCPTGVLLFTPVTWDAPMSDAMTGEYKDWFPLMVGSSAPPSFPLSEHLVLPGKIPGYILWSDRPRWGTR